MPASSPSPYARHEAGVYCSLTYGLSADLLLYEDEIRSVEGHGHKTVAGSWTQLWTNNSAKGCKRGVNNRKSAPVHPQIEVSGSRVVKGDSAGGRDQTQKAKTDYESPALTN